MADTNDIREGLAAALSALPGCTVRPYWRDDPQAPALQVAGFEAADFIDATGSDGEDPSLLVVIEGLVHLPGDDEVQAQMQFDKWVMGAGSVAKALDPTDCIGGYRLTSRLDMEGQLTHDQGPAVSSFGMREFRGYRRNRIANGVTALIGDFLVQVEPI